MMAGHLVMTKQISWMQGTRAKRKISWTTNQTGCVYAHHELNWQCFALMHLISLFPDVTVVLISSPVFWNPAYSSLSDQLMFFSHTNFHFVNVSFWFDSLTSPVFFHQVVSYFCVYKSTSCCQRLEVVENKFNLTHSYFLSHPSHVINAIDEISMDFLYFRDTWFFQIQSKPPRSILCAPLTIRLLRNKLESFFLILSIWCDDDDTASFMP